MIVVRDHPNTKAIQQLCLNGDLNFIKSLRSPAPRLSIFEFFSCRAKCTKVAGMTRRMMDPQIPPVKVTKLCTFLEIKTTTITGIVSMIDQSPLIDLLWSSRRQRHLFLRLMYFLMGKTSRRLFLKVIFNTGTAPIFSRG